MFVLTFLLAYLFQDVVGNDDTIPPLWIEELLEPQDEACLCPQFGVKDNLLLKSNGLDMSSLLWMTGKSFFSLGSAR